MIVENGTQAPQFTLPDTKKNMVSLAQFAGQKVVVLFFPAAFSGVCTAEVCGIRDEMNDYNNANAVVLGISTDAHFTLAKFKELNKLDFTLLSDYNKVVAGQYGAQYSEWILGMKGTAKRSVFIIDSTGVVRHSEILEVAGDMPDFKKVKSVLASIQ